MNLFGWIPGYTDGIYESGKEPMLLLFVAFMVTFVLTRLYTRLARIYNWGSASAGGVHMHHMVPGVILMAVCGILGFSTIYENGVAAGILAIGFGVGTALTLDEFAMIFHLRDVYWSEEGRTSVDAMLMGVALSGLLLVGFAPLDVERESATSSGELAFFVVLALNATLAAITFLKKKPFMGVIAVLTPAVGFVTAIRLAKPDSPWAHWFYNPARGGKHGRARHEHKLERATARFEYGRLGRFERWFSDLVGGAPTPASPIDAKVEPGPWGPPAGSRAQAAGTSAVRGRASARMLRLPVWQSARTTARVYAANVRILLPAALVLYIPLGLLDAVVDHLEPGKVEKFDLYTSLLLVGALGQFAAAAFGDTFYSGMTASILQARRRGSHSLWEIVKTLPYGRLIVADLIVTFGTTFGLALFVIPGIVFYTWFALTAPMIEIERLGIATALRRSRALVRGSFWTVLLLLGTLYFGSNLLTPAAENLASSLTGETLFAEWLASVVIGVTVEPIVAVTAVVLALELIELHRPQTQAAGVAA